MAHSVDRRRFLRGAGYLGLAAAGSQLLVVCSSNETLMPSPSAKVHRVGWLSAATPDWISSPALSAFRERLRELGYSEANNLSLSYSWSEVRGSAITVSRLIESKVDVIVAENSATVLHAKHDQSAVPVVFIVESDPVATGLVDSFAQPGGHLTGVTYDNLAFTAGKRLQLLTEAVPSIRKVAVLFDPGHNPGPLPYTETAAAALNLQLLRLPVVTSRELDLALDSLTKESADALILFSGGVINSDGSRILSFARAHRLPTMLDFGGWVVDLTSGDSALMCFTPSELALYRRLADLVVKVLRGAKPRDIPVERPVDYELVINLKLADAMGLTISRSVLAQATRVIR